MNDKKEEDFPNVEKEGWEAEELAEESANKDDDEIVRQMLRGNESDGDADERDVVPSLDSNDTPRGRKESGNEEE